MTSLTSGYRVPEPAMEEQRIAMQGGGYYSDNSSLQAAAIHKVLSNFEPTTTKKSSITLADFGCSEGRNSCNMMQEVLSKLPSLSSATLVFNDTYATDFSSLASTVESSLSGLSRNNTLQIHPLFAPGSFYKPRLPRSSVDVALCFSAVHWLQEVPHANGTEIEAALSAAAQRDLVDFLTARHSELAPGGQLLVTIASKALSGLQFAIGRLAASIQVLSKTWPIDPSVMARVPIYFRTKDEINAGIDGTKGKWKVVKMTEEVVEHPSSALYHNCDPNDAAKRALYRAKYASDMARVLRSTLSGFLLREVKKGFAAHGEIGHWGDEKEEAFLSALEGAFEQEYKSTFCEERMEYRVWSLQLEKPVDV